MLIVHVFIHVKEDRLEDFKKATVENAGNSIREPGIARFDVIQQNDDPTRFVLVEVYRTPEDIARHKETGHYNKWVGEVTDMLAEPRTRSQFSNVFPQDEGWG
jgi:quinol monooxygenase YgiN